MPTSYSLNLAPEHNLRWVQVHPSSATENRGSRQIQRSIPSDYPSGVARKHILEIDVPAPEFTGTCLPHQAHTVKYTLAVAKGPLKSFP